MHIPQVPSTISQIVLDCYLIRKFIFIIALQNTIENTGPMFDQLKENSISISYNAY